MSSTASATALMLASAKRRNTRACLKITRPRLWLAHLAHTRTPALADSIFRTLLLLTRTSPKSKPPVGTPKALTPMT